MDNQTIIESYREAKPNTKKSDSEIIELYVSDDEGGFINELAAQSCPSYYETDDFDFRIFERDYGVYTCFFERIVCVETLDYLIFKRC